MAQSGAEIRIESLTELEQFDRCVELQLTVWGYSDGDLIPRRVILVASRIGGQVLGRLTVAASGAGTLERLFTQLTGGTELEQRAEDFARTFRP